jgi:hypothetical protein
MFQNMTKIISFLLLLPTLLFAQTAEAEEYFETNKEVAGKLAVLTGTAYNPLLISGIVGSYKYYNTPAEERNSLPWYYSFWFCTACLILVALSFLVSIPSIFINLPSSVSAAVELCNKNIGLIVTTPIVFAGVISLSNLLADNANSSQISDQTYLYSSFIPMEWLPSISQNLWGIAIVPMLLFVFFAIWLFNYVFDVLMLLNPFGWIELFLKIARGLFYVILLAASVFFPQLIFVIVFVVAVISVFMFGWSIRRVVMGFVFLKDFLNKNKETSIDENGIVAFSNSITGIPSKSIGRLTEKDDELLFFYKKFFLFSKTASIGKSEPVLKKGSIYSQIYNNRTALCLLPPRYQKAIEQVQAHLSIYRIEDSATKKGIKWLKEKLSATDFALQFRRAN